MPENRREIPTRLTLTPSPALVTPIRSPIMFKALLSTWTLFTGIAMIMLGNGLQGSLLGVRASMEGFSTTTTGFIMTGYFVGFLGGSVLVPRWVRNVGHIRVFAALASLASVAILAHAVFINATLWTLMRLMTGFCYAGLYIVAESWLNESASNENRGQLLSLYMIVTYGGLALGQLLLNLSPPDSFVLFVVTSALISLALVPMSLSIISAPPLPAPRFISPLELYRASPLGVVGATGVGMANGAWLGMGAVYATQLGLGVNQVALFLMSNYIGAVLLQWPIGWLSDRFDRRWILTLVAFVAAGCALAALVAVRSGNPWLLYLSVGLLGGTMSPLYSLAIAHTNDFLDRDQMVAASGTLVMVGGVGASFGPTVASTAMNTLGTDGFFYGLATILTGIGTFALYRMTRRSAMPLEEQGHYLPDTPYSSTYATEYVAEEAVEWSEQQAEAAADEAASGTA